MRTQLVRNLPIRKKVGMWFYPHALAGKAAPDMKILLWNIGDYYGRLRESV